MENDARISDKMDGEGRTVKNPKRWMASDAKEMMASDAEGRMAKKAEGWRIMPK
jgi:hypothetical protein